MKPGCPTAACVRRAGRCPRAGVDTPLQRIAVHHLTTALFLSKPVRPLLRGSLREDVLDVLPGGASLERIHFPTGRVSVEAFVRMLIGQFHVPANSDVS